MQHIFDDKQCPIKRKNTHINDQVCHMNGSEFIHTYFIVQGRRMLGSEKAHNTNFIVQGTSYAWQREGTRHILHCPGHVICMAARRHTTPTSLSTRRHTYGSEKAHNTYFIVHRTSYIWKREGTQHVLHCSGDVICISASRHTTRTSVSRKCHMTTRRHTTHTSLCRNVICMVARRHTIHASLCRGVICMAARRHTTWYKRWTGEGRVMNTEG